MIKKSSAIFDLSLTIPSFDNEIKVNSEMIKREHPLRFSAFEEDAEKLKKDYQLALHQVVRAIEESYLD